MITINFDTSRYGPVYGKAVETFPDIRSVYDFIRERTERFAIRYVLSENDCPFVFTDLEGFYDRTYSHVANKENGCTTDFELSFGSSGPGNTRYYAKKIEIDGKVYAYEWREGDKHFNRVAKSAKEMFFEPLMNMARDEFDLERMVFAD